MTFTPAVVLFDLDDTLFAHSHAVEAGLAAYYSHDPRLAHSDQSHELAAWRTLEEVQYHRYLSGEIGFLEQRRERARGLATPHGIDLSDDAAADNWFGGYLVEYERAWETFPDSHPCLDALDKLIPGVRFGIVTNAVMSFQQQKMDALGLTPRIEHTIASGDVGFAKPDRRIFDAAIDVFGVVAADAVYIGDRLETDAIGAIDAGVRGIWLSRPEPTEVELRLAHSRGVTVIRSLEEVPALLA
ncbi:MAG: HAD family hydrolase [Microbacteriaceae bacterium]